MHQTYKNMFVTFSLIRQKKKKPLRLANNFYTKRPYVTSTPRRCVICVLIQPKLSDFNLLLFATSMRGYIDHSQYNYRND